ncbi:MAG: glycosyltransferase [Deltaproteobacteria bacterium]|nr:MAG: glycosyltransferase [Deltaproteobacteria bacterium]
MSNKSSPSMHQKVIEKLLPTGTGRRYWGQLVLTGIRVIRNEGWRSFFRKFRIWFSSIVWQTVRTFYYWLPVNQSTKAKLVRFAMNCGGRLFRSIGSYRYWQQPQEMELSHKQPSPHPGFYNASKREPFSFPDVPSPAISVIIPVLNQSKYTYACLYSIYERRPNVEFEVIVVDDCSADDTQDMLKIISGIQVIRNAANLGFARSVNCGAEVARGEYLLILNNDILVHHCWMDELFAVMSSHPDIGLVGSQLIYPDGRLQESGCLICQDGCAVALGRSENPLHPEFSYFREVDFCSAASVLVRKKEFHEVGGLSTDYVPAYSEDVDFAFKLREMGKRVFVQPLSKVTHYEAVSYGRYAQGDLIARSRRMFVERWQRVLKQCPYTSAENFRTTSKYNHKRVLYIDALIPKPDRGSSSADAFWYMRFLVEAGYDVVFYGQHTPGFVPKYTPMLQRIGVQCLYLPYIQIERYLSKHGSSFSHVLVARVYLAMSFNSLIRQYCPDARYIFNTVDVHFLREMRQAEVEGSSVMLEQAKRTKERELAIIEQADATIVVSEDEKELLEREYGLKRIYHIPLPREVYGSKHPFTERRDLVFIGSSHLPNLDATHYFHSEIFPLIRRDLPDINLIVIGEELRDALSDRPGFDMLAGDPAVQLVGFVEDLSEYYDWVRVMVVPLRYGSGVKGKVLTALSYGVPCVSTSIGSEGMGLTPGTDILRADEPVDFAREVVRLYTDQALWEKLSENGLNVVQGNFSEQVVRRKFLRIFAQIDTPHKEVLRKP